MSTSASTVIVEVLPRNRRVLAFVLVLALAIFGIVGIALFVSHGRAGKIIWLTPRQLMDAQSPGWLSRFGRWAQSNSVPVASYFGPAKHHAYVRTGVWNIRKDPKLLEELGAPVSINADGMRGWIIPAAQANALYDRLNVSLPGNLLEDQNRAALLFDDMASLWWQGRPGPPSKLPPGLLMVLKVKVNGNSTRLLAGIRNAIPKAKGQTVEVCFDLNCKMIIPIDSAVVIDSGDNAAKHYCVIFVPQRIEDYGKRAKP